MCLSVTCNIYKQFECVAGSVHFGAMDLWLNVHSPHQPIMEGLIDIIQDESSLWDINQV